MAAVKVCLVHGEPLCAANRASTAAEVFYRRAVMFLIQSFVIRVADGSNADAMCLSLWLESRDGTPGWLLGWLHPCRTLSTLQHSKRRTGICLAESAPLQSARCDARASRRQVPSVNRCQASSFSKLKTSCRERHRRMLRITLKLKLAREWLRAFGLNLLQHTLQR